MLASKIQLLEVYKNRLLGHFTIYLEIFLSTQKHWSWCLFGTFNLKIDKLEKSYNFVSEKKFIKSRQKLKHALVRTGPIWWLDHLLAN